MAESVVLCGDALEMLKTLPDESAQCCVTSPPYWGLRDYGHDGQLGLEKTPEEYVANMVEVFREVRRVLKSDGTLWLNLGDSYAGSGKGIGSNHGKAVFSDGEITKTDWDAAGLKPKDLVGIPWRVAFALQADGWWLRQDIIWSKPNPMPESVTDRCTKAHEYIFMLSKSARYFYDHDAILEPAAYDGRKDEQMKGSTKYNNGCVPGRSEQTMASRGHTRWNKDDDGNRVRNKRSVWNVATQPYSGSHFAVFPEAIPTTCIKAGSKVGDTILEPFAGSGTTLEVAKRLGREFIGIELNEKYIRELIEPRLANVDPLFTNAAND